MSLNITVSGIVHGGREMHRACRTSRVVLSVMWFCYSTVFQSSSFGGVGMSLNVACRRLVLSMYLNSACWVAFSERRCAVDNMLRPSFSSNR